MITVDYIKIIDHVKTNVKDNIVSWKTHYLFFHPMKIRVKPHTSCHYYITLISLI